MALAEVIVTAVFSFFGAVVVALIGYCTYRYQRRNAEEGSNIRSNGGISPSGNTNERNNPFGKTQSSSQWTRFLARTLQTTISERTPTSIKTFTVQVTEQWGWNEGHPFEHNGFDGINIIEISCGKWIDSLRVQYIRDGNLIWTSLVGSEGGSFHEIELQNEEYITAVQGYYGRHQGTGIITSLTFATNKNRHFGPFGKVKWWWKLLNLHRSFKIKGMIVGFHGTAGRFISSIGFYWRPIHDESKSQLLSVVTTSPLLVEGDAAETTTHLSMKETPEFLSSKEIILTPPVVPSVYVKETTESSSPTETTLSSVAADPKEKMTDLRLTEITESLSPEETTLMPPVVPSTDVKETTESSSSTETTLSSVVANPKEKMTDLCLTEITESLSPKETTLMPPVVPSTDAKETTESSSSIETTLPSVVADPKEKMTDLCLTEITESLSPKETTLMPPVVPSTDAKETTDSSSSIETTLRSQQKVVIKVAIADAKKRYKALQTVAGFHGVTSISEENGQITVVGEGIDPVKITTCLRKKCGFAQLVSTAVEEKTLKKPTPPPLVGEPPRNTTRNITTT